MADTHFILLEIGQSSSTKGEGHPFAEERMFLEYRLIRSDNIYLFIFYLSIVQNMDENKIMLAYKKSQQLKPLICQYGSCSSYPLTYQDSISAPNHPFCTLGVLKAEGEWGSKTGIAFVFEDNYLLTCASNCYQHKHGEYPRITFTINSNKKSGYDTYKVNQVFIPQQYKKQPQNQRNKYNYALLYIEGDPKMKDRYGSIGIQFQYIQQMTPTYMKCDINNQCQLQPYEEHKIEQMFLNQLSGGPLFADHNGRKTSIGLIFSEGKRSLPFSMRFNKGMYYQLLQWVQVQSGWFALSSLPTKELDMSCLRYMEKKPINTVYLWACNLDGKCSSFFKELPFSTVSEILLCGCQIGNDLLFLRERKFKDLKYLSIQKDKVGPAGCQIIASLPYNNIRCLNLSNNPIGNQGCQRISAAQWPFLRQLQLRNCEFGNEGARQITRRKWRNLIYLDLQQNRFDNEVSAILQAADFPRIDNLDLSNLYNLEETVIERFALTFLKYPSWKTLTRLALKHSRVGNNGCKMIKQSSLALIVLELTGCHISSVGVKWLCKANLTRISQLKLLCNSVGDEGCHVLSRAIMPSLNQIDLLGNALREKGMKQLLRAEWIKQVTHRGSSFPQLAKSFKGVEFSSWGWDRK